MSERQADPTAEVRRAVGLDLSSTAKGLCIVVLQAVGTPESSDLPFPAMVARLAIRVLEDPVRNQTGTRALTVARRITRVLWHYTPTRISSPLVPENPTIVGAEDDFAPVAYDVLFSAREAKEPTTTKVIMPTITEAGAALPYTITLACATSGAAIYYTTDGSHPAVGNATATLYTTPFVVSTACELRAVAYKTGSIASDGASIGIS